MPRRELPMLLYDQFRFETGIEVGPKVGRLRVPQRVSFAAAPELNKIGGSDVADVSCKLIVTV